MKPSTRNTYYSGLGVQSSEFGEFTAEEFKKMFVIPGSDDRVVVWNGHEVETASAVFTHYPDFYSFKITREDAHEWNGLVYYPIDQRTKESDWQRCVKVEHNEDGTAWIPIWDEDTMIDYEKEVVGAVVNLFQPELDEAQIKVNEATNLSVRSQSVAVHRTLVSFREQVRTSVEEWSQSLYIGWQDQNPHEAHIHLPLLRAVNSVMIDWQANHSDDWSKVSESVSAIVSGLSIPHSYERRWDQDARLIREGFDPVGGYEYCFTLAVSDEELTEMNKLPDPEWIFDSLASSPGGYLRGGQTYWDGEPTPSEARPWIHRFKRPIPEGTAPQTNLGSVSWELDIAYKTSR